MDTDTPKIEERLGALERDVAVIKSNYVTKGDLHRELNAQTWKFVTFVCTFNGILAGAIYFIASHAK